MGNEKEISEGTTIKLELKHLFAFLGGLVAILVTVIGFFYGMLNSNIDKKVEDAVYQVEKKNLEKKDEDFKVILDKIDNEVTATNKSVQVISIDIAEIKARQNSSGHHESVNSTPVNSMPGNNTPR